MRARGGGGGSSSMSRLRCSCCALSPLCLLRVHAVLKVRIVAAVAHKDGEQSTDSAKARVPGRTPTRLQAMPSGKVNVRVSCGCLVYHFVWHFGTPCIVWHSVYHFYNGMQHRARHSPVFLPAVTSGHAWVSTQASCAARVVPDVKRASSYNSRRTI
jgi:hypothetical protein